MNQTLLLEIVLNNGFLLDVFGILGLGLVGLAGVHLVRRFDSPGAHIAAWGTVALIIGRLISLTLSQVMTPQLASAIGGKAVVDSIAMLSLTLLTAGLGAIVWGLWNHEQALPVKS